MIPNRTTVISNLRFYKTYTGHSSEAILRNGLPAIREYHCTRFRVSLYSEMNIEKEVNTFFSCALPVFPQDFEYHPCVPV
jgi:hypothetical protein